MTEFNAITRRVALVGAAAAAAALPNIAEAQTPPVVTILGDSITAGYGLPARDALPVQLQASLARQGVRAVVRGAGVSGSTSAGGLRRVDQVRDDTRVAVVALGGNDLLQLIPFAQTQANLDAIVQRLQRRGFTVVLAGMRAPPELGAFAVQFDQVFAEVARRRNVIFYPFLLDGVALDPRYNQSDRVHPNAQGVRIIADRLAPVVARALQARAARA